MGGVNCIQIFFGFLDFFYIYKVPNHVRLRRMHQDAVYTSDDHVHANMALEEVKDVGYGLHRG